jgi:O-antigen/teichoic acid export membrane protein
MDHLQPSPHGTPRRLPPYQRWFCQRGSMLHDIAVAAVANGGVLLCSMLAYALAARKLGQADLTSYMLIRRVTQSVMPVVMLGMPVALSRYVALRGAQDRPYTARAVFITSGAVLLSLALLCLGSAIFPGLATELMFGDAKDIPLLGAMLIVLVGLVWCQQLYSYFMGQLQTRLANALQLLSGGVAPLLPLLLLSNINLMQVLYIAGALAVLGCLPFAFDPLRRCAKDIRWREFLTRQTWDETRQFLVYGLTRVPGFAAMGALWSAVPLYLRHIKAASAETYVLAGIQTLLLTTIALQPVSSVLLPRVADLKGAGGDAGLARAMSMVHRLLLHLGLIVLLQVPIAVPVVVRAWLLIDTPEGLGVISLIALAVPAFVAFNILRNPIDAATHVPFNTYTLSGALALQLGVLFTLLHLGAAPSWSAGIALLASFVALGAATLVCSVKLFEPRGAHVLEPALYGAAGLALGWCALGLGLDRALAGQSIWIKLGALGLYELVVFSVSFAALFKLRAAWAVEVVGKLRSKLRQAPCEPPAQT